MRVVMLAGRLSRRASGVRQMVEGLSGALSELGVDIHVLGLRDEAWDAADKETWSGAPADVFSSFGPPSFGFAPRLGTVLENLSPDIVHLNGLWMYSAFVAQKWVHRRGGSLLVSPHGMLAPQALTYSRRRKAIVRRLFQDECLSSSSAFHATAGEEAKDIKKFVGDVPVEIIPNGVNMITAKDRAWEQRERRVLALGRLHPVKGYEALLHAWAQVEQLRSDWELEIAGPDPDGYGSKLRNIVRELNLSHVRIGQPRYGRERDEYICNSRIFALPSHTENFALTVPEALMCGTPVIASTGAPWEGLVTNNCGWWVEPRPQRLASALLEAFALDGAKLEAMGTAGRNWALSAFSWTEIAQQFAQLYKTILK